MLKCYFCEFLFRVDLRTTESFPFWLSLFNFDVGVGTPSLPTGFVDFSADVVISHHEKAQERTPI